MITEIMKDVFYREIPSKNMKMYTGAGGADLFEEELYFQGTGFKRRYIGKKAMRLIRKVHRLYKSHTGNLYFHYKPTANE